MRRERWYQLAHLPTGKLVARVRRIDGFWEKGRGVIGMPALPPGEGVWLPDVASVHTFFVRFPLELLFLDAGLRTCRFAAPVSPWRPLISQPGAIHTLELGAGTLRQIAVSPGDGWVMLPLL